MRGWSRGAWAATQYAERGSARRQAGRWLRLRMARMLPDAAAFLRSWAASRYRPRAWAASPSAAWSSGAACAAAAAQNCAGGIWLARCARPCWSR